MSNQISACFRANRYTSQTRPWPPSHGSEASAMRIFTRWLNPDRFGRAVSRFSTSPDDSLCLQLHSVCLPRNFQLFDCTYQSCLKEMPISDLVVFCFVRLQTATAGPPTCVHALFCRSEPHTSRVAVTPSLSEVDAEFTVLILSDNYTP
jgi:hypothetical protein